MKGKTPFQTVRADFPHTAYRWSLVSQHYAASGYWMVPRRRCSPGPAKKSRVHRSASPARRLRPLRFTRKLRSRARRSASIWLNLPCGVPGAEVVAPAAQHGVQVADQHPHVLHPVPVAAGQLLHALPHPLHAALRRPALEEVDALARPLPDRSAHALAQVAAEEVEALLAPGEIHPPRLVRVQLQTEPREHFAHALLGLLARRRRAAHHDEVVRVAHQRAQMGTVALPHGVEHVQVDVRQAAAR